MKGPAVMFQISRVDNEGRKAACIELSKSNDPY